MKQLSLIANNKITKVSFNFNIRNQIVNEVEISEKDIKCPKEMFLPEFSSA